jgi:hypothetical protein
MAAKNRNHRGNRNPMIFSPWNYKVLAVGLLLVVVGFTAMYLENEVEGFISLYLSPIVIMGGYITVIVAILKHDHSSSSASDPS